jgi:hypothetical protein
MLAIVVAVVGMRRGGGEQREVLFFFPLPTFKTEVQLFHYTPTPAVPNAVLIFIIARFRFRTGGKCEGLQCFFKNLWLN